MISLYTLKNFNDSKSTDNLPLECYYCHKEFNREKKEISFEIKHQRGNLKYCSRSCIKSGAIKELNCTNCNVKILKYQYVLNKSKTNNHFCSRSCAATYNNKHKTHGTRRSKLEIWIEEQLTDIYPDLHIDYNQKDAIGSELDIYMPSLNVAFELNGIFHYEPIYGKDKLQHIQENDISKSKTCHDHKIDLCVIDTSAQKYVKPSTSQKYLDIIINIVKERLTS